MATAEYIFETLSAKINTKRVYLVGQSLGGAVATYTTVHSKRKFKGIILENTFLSIDDMVDSIFPYLSTFKKLLLANHWRTVDIITKVKTPKLFISSTKDQIVPAWHMDKLFEMALGKKRMVNF